MRIVSALKYSKRVFERVPLKHGSDYFGPPLLPCSDVIPPLGVNYPMEVPKLGRYALRIEQCRMAQDIRYEAEGQDALNIKLAWHGFELTAQFKNHLADIVVVTVGDVNGEGFSLRGLMCSDDAGRMYGHVDRRNFEKNLMSAKHRDDVVDLMLVEQPAFHLVVVLR